jgi:hypothetical protein
VEAAKSVASTPPAAHPAMRLISEDFSIVVVLPSRGVVVTEIGLPGRLPGIGAHYMTKR